MDDNLMFLLNKLSHVIVSQEFEKDKNQPSKKRSVRVLNNCVKRVRQKGCDILLNKTSGTVIEDPCVTDYGGNWSPVTLITDYGRELKAQGYGKYNDLLLRCISTLEDKEYECVSEILKLLLLLKKPIIKESSGNFQNDLPLNSSDYLLNGMESLSFLNEDFSSDAFSKLTNNKKAINYEESWTKHFDSKFQVLGELSKKNLITSEKLSLKTLFSSRTILNSSQSHTNSFGFTDFFSPNGFKSEKSLFDINSCPYLTETPLLDSFVEHPITHKLPASKLTQGLPSRGALSDKSSEPLKQDSSKGAKISGDAVINEGVSAKASAIELKRNSNCSHSFSILYEKSVKSQVSSIGSKSSQESFPSSKDTSKNKKLTESSGSKEIILGLWEQEQSIIKEFKPELADTFPELRMIPLLEYVVDVKYLFTGINSETFQYDSNSKRFTMVYGTCLDDVTPESLYHFSKEFMEAGDCYVKLISCINESGKNNFDACTTISQAFWKSIFDYLELHYSLVLDIPVSINLMALKSCTRDLCEIIKTIAIICKVYGPEETLPEGGELLTYLLQVAERISKQCILNIVFGILQNCCNVYFMCILQSWMFKGKQEFQNNEFFVDYHRHKIKKNSRAYYNSFFLIDSKIPSFLRGYEESFYNCGKSIHFLKLFNAEDKFCQILEKGYYPSMRICFSEERLEKLESDFNNYEERVLKLCGDRITIKTIRDEEKEKERKYLEYIKEYKMKQEKKREEALLKKLKEAKTKKAKKNELLNEQRSAIDAEKERRKQKEKEEKLKLEKKIKKENESRENLLNSEKKLLEKYYDDAIQDLEKRAMVAESRKENLKRIISGRSPMNSDINSNEIQIDQEGNIVNHDQISNETRESEKLLISTKSEVESVKTPDLSNRLDRSNLNYDENSNPSLKTKKTPEANANVPIEDVKIRKSSSFQTIAAEEAKKNKCKILRSEFGIQTGNETAPKKSIPKPEESMTELEKNRWKVMQSEYNILLKSKETLLSFTSFTEHELSKSFKTSNEKSKSNNFNSVKLERKQECTNLNAAPEKFFEVPAESESSDSCMTLSNEVSVENMSNVCEELETLKSHNSSIGLSEKYLDALARDTEIFQKKSSHQGIFCTLKEDELDNLPCTDFLKFQRYLRKSALIPLRVQENLANDALLKHLLKGENLLSHLNSLRGYFFLNDGEFGRSFTHNTFRSLAKCTEPKQFFERSNLSNIVNEALNYTIHCSEPNSQNLSFRIVKMPPFLNHSSHDVLSPFELSYKVDWPLNFILTEKALSKYKMVFRFLLKLKRINWTLNENFLYLNSYFKSKRLNRKFLVASTHYHKIQIYRHAMTQVMITLDDYIFSNGVQFPWIFFLKDLETTENIDHLYQKHVKYIKDVLTRCFLSKNSEDLLDCIHNLIELALKFHYTAKSSAMEVVGEHYEHPKFSVLKATFSEFCTVIKTFLKTLKEKISSNQVLRSHYVLIEKFDLKLT